LQPPFIVIPGEILGEMGVSINETRTQRRVTEIYDTRARWNLKIASCVQDLVVFYDDYAILDQRVRLAIEHSCGFEHNEFISRVRRRAKTEESQNQQARDFHPSH
jgi:hypothetical protein